MTCRRAPLRGCSWNNGSNTAGNSLLVAEMSNVRGCNMPKTHKNLYTQLLGFEVLHTAFERAKRGKRYRQYVLKFESDLESNLLEIIADLEAGTYKTSGYSEFYVFEPKRRTVAKLVNFRDRVVQHAVCAVIEPIFERLFINDSYACRKGKGTHAGADRAEQMMRKVRREHEAVFALKCDIRKYFDSIDHGILKRILSEKIGDARMMSLLSGIIDFKTVRLAMASNMAHASKANSNGILSKLLHKPFVRSAA